MKNLRKLLVAVIMMIVATSGLSYGQGMVYQTHQTMTLGEAGNDGQGESWVQLPNDDYVRVTSTGSSVTIESTAGWTQTISNIVNDPCIAQYDGTIWVAMAQYEFAVTIGSTTHPAPPAGLEYTILVKLNSSGSILASWQAVGAMNLRNIAVKNNSEIALVGDASLALEHLTSPDGGAVVLIHNGTDWDTSKGFFIETPSGGGSQPLVTSAQYLPNGNLALAGYTYGGNVDFGGINLPPHGLFDGFRGEITPQGVGIQAVQMAGSGTERNHLQTTKADGSFMVSGTYTQLISFYNANGSVGGTLGQFPTGASHDHVYFAFYNASGVFQNAEVAYNNDAGTSLLNIDIATDDGAFYAMIGNTNGGPMTTPTESHDGLGSITLKFDNAGIPVWSKQFEEIAGSGEAGDFGEEIIVDGDNITLCGREMLTADLDFNAGVVAITAMTYISEYFDGTVTGPTSNFSGTPTSLEAGETVSFTDLSGDGTYPITSWTWTFQGGTPGTFSGQNPPNIVYATAGTFDVSLTISDGDLSDTEIKTDYISVSAPAPYLSIDPSYMDVEATSGNVNNAFQITSNESWTITTSNSSIIATPSSGNGDQSINVSYPSINTMAGETYSVTITSATNLVEVFTINQNGVSAYITLSDYEETVSATADSYSITVNCPDDMTVTGTEGDFSSPSPLSFTGSQVVTIDYEENTSEDERVDILTFSGNGESAEFTLTQVGANADLVATISVNKLHFTTEETVHITCSATGGTGNYDYDGTVSPGGYTFIGSTFSFVSMEVGHYIATVIVNDGENTVTATVEFDVHEIAIDLWVSNQNAHVGEIIDFTTTVILEANDPRIVEEIYIEFGDGDDISGFTNPFECEHSYSESNSFDIEISAFLSDGSIYNISFPNHIEITVGVNEENNSSDIKIYPNPTNGQLFISTGKTAEMLSVEDMTGHEVSRLEKLIGVTQINLSEFPAGVYFVRIYMDGVLSTHKVLKQ